MKLHKHWLHAHVNDLHRTSLTLLEISAMFVWRTICEDVVKLKEF